MASKSPEIYRTRQIDYNTATMALVYVGMGSNVGDREEQILRAVHEMRSFSRVKKISTLIETLPQGVAYAEPKFMNAVVELETDFDPKEVMQELLRIEEDMGRVRSEPGAPREIDLDLLSYDAETIESSELTIPHPRMHERRFVLGPLAELNPQWKHPVLGASIQDLLAKLPDEG